MFSRKVVLKEEEQLTLEVINNMISRKECLIESTDTFDYFLTLEDLQYFVWVDSHGVKITNHAFIVVKSFRSDALDTFKKSISDEVSRRIETKKKEIFKNETDLLLKLCQTINN